MGRTYKEVAEYVERQNHGAGKVLSAKPEHHFDDLGDTVTVWNVKTDNAGDWWVVEGNHTPMNLYPQSAYYFSADEVYSFHMGLMDRMRASCDQYRPEGYVEAMTLDAEIAPVLFRKLKSIASQIDDAQEVEDFQAIGVQCREILIELGNTIYSSEMAEGDEQPQASNFKKKAELFVRFNLPGGDNSDYRSIIKKLTEATWDYACKLTHSQSTTFYEASSCVSLIMSLVSVYENIRQKKNDLIATYQCSNCKSKKLSIVDAETNDEQVIIRMHLRCEECGELMQIEFENAD